MYTSYGIIYTSYGIIYTSYGNLNVSVSMPFLPLIIREYPSLPAYRFSIKHSNLSRLTNFAKRYVACRCS